MHVSTRRHLTGFDWQGEGVESRGAGGARGADGRWTLQDQLPFAALEADGERALHLWGELIDDVLVVSEPGQVLSVAELRHLPAHGAGQALELHGGHVDARQTLQAEGVAAREQLRSLEDVVIGTEADGALCLIHVILRWSGFLAVTPSFPPLSSPGLLAPASAPALSVLPVSPAAPVPLSSLRVDAPGSPGPTGLLLLLPVITFTGQPGFDVLDRSAVGVSIWSASVTHDGGMMVEVWATVSPHNTC